ncbi:hypothetical protein I6B53_10865 [Schaalia sp. 19OD2882]|uniref:sensor histidine kinase n=1 Tax=Schaalia sp. 19OD2882 TaxID=2794089 RepID=UPI001C1EC59E|nr:hypothetical protein [Schaalia sp. 19OD2882]QWW19554.1 hypothetical protein I6B53_10865 [Schaalia sp. 19OD2882]
MRLQPPSLPTRSQARTIPWDDREVSVIAAPAAFGAWRLRRVGRNHIDLRRSLAVMGGLVSVIIDLLFLSDFAPEFRRVGAALTWIGYVPVHVLPPVIALIAAIQLYRDRRQKEPAHLTQEDHNPTLVTLRLGAGRSRLDYVWETLTVIHLVLYALSSATFFYLRVTDPARMWTGQEWTTPLTHQLPVAVPLAAITLSLVWRFTYVVVVAPVHMVLTSTVPWPVDLHAVVSVTMLLAHGLLTLGMFSWLLRQTSVLDRSERAHWSETDRLVERQASSLARQRANDFIHDHVLSALAPVIAGVEDREQLRRAASVAKAALTMSVDKQVPRHASDVFATIRHQVEAMGVPVRIQVLVEEDVLLPALVATALSDCAFETLSNSRKHAVPAHGAGATRKVDRWVRLSAANGRVGVVVGDDGAGFELRKVNRTRHGLQHSLNTRIEDVGGRVGIFTAPGAGTIIDIGWFEKAPVCSPLAPWPEILRQAEASGTEGTPRTLPTRPSHPVHALASTKQGRRGRSADDDDPSTLDAIPWQEPFSAAMEKRSSRFLAAVGAGAHLLCLLLALELYTSNIAAWLAFGTIAISALVLVLPRSNTVMATQTGYEMALGAILGNMTLYSAIPLGASPGWADWSTSALAMICYGLLVRGRRGPVYLIQGAALFTTGAWLVQGHQSLLELVHHNGPLVGTVFVWGLVTRLAQHTSTATRRQMRRSQLRTARSRIEEEVTQVMQTTLSSVSHRVTPVLDGVIGDGELTPELVTQARLVEAELRDGIRAQFFVGTQVTSAARRARARGVELVLLDDNRGAYIPEAVRRRVLEYVVVALDTTAEGSLVIRLLPPGRPFLLTITRNSQALLRLDDEGLPVA